ncbi:MotA/TolQ/ExbB proton channel family protein [Desulfobacula phenolica]|uniref:Biopolymer transport protein ExbB n=1 Tax=Desulfobacula phenolica TaxID=90732 RepID=A0A1H2HK42_9BACT|nr:MotA/TolQ/ExbB proton channel family protein [Desulfobacula phenolica]SDU32215.1 biopolymer transport protein ExbB [Desulfobacula phenolica]
MIKKPIFICIIMVCLATLPAFSQDVQPDMQSDRRSDMRSDYKTFEQQRRQLIQKALDEKKEAQKEAQDQLTYIKSNKQALKKAIAQLKTNITNLKAENKQIQTHITELKLEEDRLKQELEKTSGVNREFSGFVRSNAKDLKALLLESLQSGLTPGRHNFLEPVILQEKFPSMDDVRKLVHNLFDEIHTTGQVTLTKGLMVDRQGKEQEAKLLILGNFTGIYLLDKEAGFLLYSDQSQRYFALSKLPSSRITNNITAYMQGKSDNVYMDVSKGGAIRQLAHQLNLMEQVPKGGAIVWPILIILVIAVLILIERVFFFTQRRTHPEQLMKTIRKMIMADDWKGCRKFLESKNKKLLPQVLLTAMAFKDQTRQDMENALQEAILGQIPKIERFLSTLGMLAAIAPLLGLLGTVTGMINTFHVITYYGTGDPRMMSGGISEALVTTMLGLSVAIPIMLAHTFLSRRVETQISRMEEKSVAFVNLVFKNRNESRQ